MTKLRQLSTAAIVFLFAVSVLIVSPTIIASEEDLDSLNFKIEGHYMGEEVVFEYWLDNINTEDELFRMETTEKDDDDDRVIMGAIRNKEKKVFYKDIKQTGSMWVLVPNGEAMWQDMRTRIIEDEEDEVFWLKNEGEEVYMEMVNVDGEEEEVKLYDISANEPIEESKFEVEQR